MAADAPGRARVPGLTKFRPIRPGSRIALVAPASSFSREEFDAGVTELKRLGLRARVGRRRVRSRRVHGRPRRACARWPLMRAFDTLGRRCRDGRPRRLRQRRAAAAARSGAHPPIAHGIHRLQRRHVDPQLSRRHGRPRVRAWADGRRPARRKGPSAYDPTTFLRSLSAEPLGELTPARSRDDPARRRGTVSVRSWAARSPRCSRRSTRRTQFRPPDGHVLLLDEVGERPYQLHRMLTQLRLTGRLVAGHRDRLRPVAALRRAWREGDRS